MAEVITRLRVESSEYDSKINRARQGLLHMEEACRKAGDTLAVLKKEDKAFVESLGSMETVSRTARGSVNELTQAFTDLSIQYKRLTDEEKKGDFGKALSASLSQLKTRIDVARQDLADVTAELNGNVGGGGGFLSGLGNKMGGAIQVFAGNMLTKAAGAVANIGSEMANVVRQSIELSRSAEGIERAYERLGRGDLMAKLKEETHGTVSELQLMKAAVKFNDFNLPVEQLGTMLAFAQQKAQDTGQSVDYMVESIVTGLGRKSLMILDNLGLSAAEIKERMKETGDMTTAVADIIRDRMAQAGGYVETAASRAAKANADLEDGMKRLGDTFKPLADSFTSTINSMKVSAIDLLNSAIKPLINSLTVAGALRKNGVDAAQKLNELRSKDSGFSQQFNYNATMREYQRSIEAAEKQLAQLQKTPTINSPTTGINSDPFANRRNDLQRAIEGLKAEMEAYKAGAQQILNSATPTNGGNVAPTADPTKTSKSVAKELDPMQVAQKRIADLTKEALTADDSRLGVIREEVAALQQEVVLYERRQQYISGKSELPTGSVGVEPGYIASARRNQRTPSALEKAEYEARLTVRAEDVKVDTATLNTVLADALRNGIDVTGLDLTPLADKVAAGINVPDETWQTIIDQYNDMREQIGLDPIVIDIKTGNIGKDVAKTAQDTNKAWQAAASAITSAGSALQNMEDPAAKVAGIVMQAIANVALGFAQASASPATGAAGVFGWIAAATAGVATMTATIAQIKSATKGGFAQGGIVPGNNFTGDNLRTSDYGINSGELVLTRAQTGNLAQQLQGDSSGVSVVDMEVRGEALYVVLGNYLDASGKTLKKWVQ
jgi:hypothetical protein